MKMKILFLGLSILLSAQLYGQFPKSLLIQLKVEPTKQSNPKMVNSEIFHLKLEQAKKQRVTMEKSATTITKKEQVKVLKNHKTHSMKQGFVSPRLSPELEKMASLLRQMI